MPSLPAPARRSTVPVLASVVPLVGACGLWIFTGSVFALWFAALGPLIAGAGALDAWRSRRRDLRRGRAERERVRGQIAQELGRRHAAERDDLWARHPDVRGYLAHPDEIWRAVPGRDGALVVGRGVVDSPTRVHGDDDEVTREIRALAARVDDAPVVVPAHVGLAIVGPPVLAVAVARALIIQLCCSHPPGQLALAGRGRPDWAMPLPHHGSAVRTCHVDARAASGRGPMDPAVVVVEPGAPAPPVCAAVLTLTGFETARLDYAGRTAQVRVEAVGADQAERIAAALAERAASIGGVRAVPETVGFSDLAGDERSRALRVALGRDENGPVLIDLVADGPHAVVTGMTGAGKSELLVTWVARLCALRSTREVVFLLVDFKGGTAFQSLAGLPHVTGVLTDLEGAGAERALESLRAEVRHREGVIARAGARDIDHPAVDLPRLVIAVDELAALLEGHRELAAVLADVAARGRALGMHLVLGTQRAAGVVRDALMANCPLRISLRVVDAADSRMMLGTDAAATLSGEPAGRGLALVRRASDAAPMLFRVARTGAADISTIGRAREAEPPPRRPWQPALPSHLPLGGLVDGVPVARDPIIGLVDEPERQRHRLVRLDQGGAGLVVVGGPGSGKSTCVAVLAAQTPSERLLRLPVDPESLWDVLHRLGAEGAPAGTLIVGDDIDASLTEFPQDYGAAAASMIEQICRTARGGGWRVVLSSARLTGAMGRIADLVPRRIVLRTASRFEHVASGGEHGAWRPASPPGRGHLDGRQIQIPWTEPLAPTASSPPREWRVPTGVSGLVMPGGGARRLVRALEAQGARIQDVTDDAEALLRGFEPSGASLALIGSAEQWQRAWRVLQAVRSRGALVVEASCLAEYRLLTGDREPPPYCSPGLGRAWALGDGGVPERVRLPGLEPALRRRAA